MGDRLLKADAAGEAAPAMNAVDTSAQSRGLSGALLQRKIARRIQRRADAGAGAIDPRMASALGAVFPLVAAEIARADSQLGASVARIANDCSGVVEQGGDDERALSLWLAWVAQLPSDKQLFAAGGDPTRTQVYILAFLEEALTRRADGAKAVDLKLLGARERVSAMRRFYASMTKDLVVPGGEIDPKSPLSNDRRKLIGGSAPGMIPEQAAVSSQRQTMIGLAMAQIGKIDAFNYNDTDDDGTPARKGWRTLKMFYDGAAASYVPKLLKHGDGLEGQGKGDNKLHGIGAWCGIFATWAARSAGLSVGGWPALASLPQTLAPKPGDIVNTNDERNHFAIITWVGKLPAKVSSMADLASVEIRTVDGNSGWTMSGVTENALFGNPSRIGQWGNGVRGIEPAPPPKP